MTVCAGCPYSREPCTQHAVANASTRPVHHPSIECRVRHDQPLKRWIRRTATPPVAAPRRTRLDGRPRRGHPATATMTRGTQRHHARPRRRVDPTAGPRGSVPADARGRARAGALGRSARVRTDTQPSARRGVAPLPLPDARPGERTRRRPHRDRRPRRRRQSAGGRRLRPRPRAHVARQRHLPPGGRRLARRCSLVLLPPARRRPRLQHALVAMGRRHGLAPALPREPGEPRPRNRPRATRHLPRPTDLRAPGGTGAPCARRVGGSRPARDAPRPPTSNPRPGQTAITQEAHLRS